MTEPHRRGGNGRDAGSLGRFARSFVGHQAYAKRNDNERDQNGVNLRHHRAAGG
jgi:hypothetical protein